MPILIFLIAGIIIALTDYFIFENDKNVKTIIKSLFTYTFMVNILTLSVLKYILKKPNTLIPSAYTTSFCMKYIAFALFVGAVLLIIKGILNSKITFTKSIDKSSKKALTIKLVSFIIFVIGMVFIFFSRWFIDFFGNITPEQFLFNLKSPIKGTSNDMYLAILNVPLYAIVTTSTLFLIFINFKYDIFINLNSIKRKVLSQKSLRIIALTLAIILGVGGVAYGSKKLSLDQVAKAYFANSTFFDDNYTDPKDVKMSFPAKKRNLIHIYLESVENSYLSKELGGFMDVNLMPELTELSKEGISFSDNDKFGGPYQTYGSSWSVASMINMGNGIPLKIPMGGNSYGKSGSFLPGSISIGDILEAQGYNQTIMFGADADYGGLTTYFETHGNFNIFDYKAAKEKGLIPDDYYVWWGYEDDKLYDYAKEELTRLHNEGKPFNFTMETADTHFPDGYMSPNAEIKYGNQYANVISYSTKEAVDFIRWIQDQPFYEDTTIVVTGDHLSMDTNFFLGFDPNYHRSVFNLILNSPVTTEDTKNREFAPFDFFPTVLASMGIDIEGNRLGLGTNLFSTTPTLIEEQGLESVEKGLEGNSNYFNDEFIDEKKDSVFENTLVTEK